MTCVLCGGPADQMGRFCLGCVGDQGQPSRPRWARPAVVGRPHLAVLEALRWPLVALLLGGVGLAGLRAGDRWRAARRLSHLPASEVAARLHLTHDGSLAQLAVTAAIGVVFLAWWAVAYGNLGALGVRRRNSSRWAVGSWFLPFVGLVAPKRTAEELWFGSDVETPLGWGWVHGAASGLVTCWWVCWLASVALAAAAPSAVAAAAAHRPDLLPVVASAAGSGLALGAGLLAVAGVCAASLVMTVTSGQVARARAIEDAGLVAA